jgi:flagellar basal-body rod protein FlgG
MRAAVMAVRRAADIQVKRLHGGSSMIEGFGAALSALSAQQQRMDALAGDTANVNTAGYRAERTSFSEVAPPARGVVATQRGPSGAQGALAETGQPLDLAIEGDGWFQVAGPSGQPVLTRAGVFDVDARGQIVTSSGDQLVPPVQLPPGAGASGVAVGPDGTVTVAGARIAQIPLFSVPAPDALQPVGGGRYAPTAGSGAATPATGAVVRQGALESSNVDLGDTAVGLIETRDSFAAAAKALHVQDEMLAALLAIRDDGKRR